METTSCLRFSLGFSQLPLCLSTLFFYPFGFDLWMLLCLVSVKLGRLSLGSARQGRSGLDDLLASADGGKHDYDW